MEPFENIVGKEENVCNQYFLLFLNVFFFIVLLKTIFIFQFKFILSSSNAFNMDQSLILSFGKEFSKGIYVMHYTKQVITKLWIHKNPFIHHTWVNPEEEWSLSHP